MQTACGSQLDQPPPFALFHGEAQSPVTIGHLALPVVAAREKVVVTRVDLARRNKLRTCQFQDFCMELICLHPGSSQQGPKSIATNCSNMSIDSMEQLNKTHNGLPNCAMNGIVLMSLILNSPGLTTRSPEQSKGVRFRVIGACITAFPPRIASGSREGRWCSGTWLSSNLSIGKWKTSEKSRIG